MKVVVKDMSDLVGDNHILVVVERNFMLREKEGGGINLYF